MNKPKCYISTPITGFDIRYVKERISIAKNTLEKRGYEPVSPLDASPDENASYAEHMGNDIRTLIECDTVAFVGGFNESKGCRLEYAAAEIYEKEIIII